MSGGEEERGGEREERGRRGGEAVDEALRGWRGWRMEVGEEEEEVVR